MVMRLKFRMQLLWYLLRLLVMRGNALRLGQYLYRAVTDFVKSSRLPQWKRVSQCEGRIVRIGFVGAGNFARYHLDVLASSGHVEVTAICSTGSERSRVLAADYQIGEVYSDLTQFVEAEAVDAYFVVVPALKMHSIALELLTAGKPIFIEKPAGLSSSDTRQLLDQARKYNTFAMVGYNRRFYSVVEHGLAALADCGPIRGGICEVPEMISGWRHSRKHDPVVYDNWMFIQSSHAIDLFRYILGRVKSVKTVNVPNHGWQNAAASFNSLVEFENGICGHIMSLWDVHPRWRIRIVAERGSIEFDGLETCYLCTEKNERIPIPRDQIDSKFRNGIFAQDMKFIEAVQRNSPPSLPACLLEDAFETNRLIEKILGDVETGEVDSIELD